MAIYNPEAFASLPGLANDFHSAQPYKHIVIDGLFDAQFLRQVAGEFYPLDDPRWSRFHNANEEKLVVSNSEQHLPPTVKTFLRELNAEPFLKQLTALTGIEGLIPDPYLGGAGMHCIPRGGRLAIHADFNIHPLMRVDRRLNLLIYLNEDWQESYGGHLELWDRAMQHCVRRILPIFNRTVLFLTDDFSFHGHPDPLNCPEQHARKSIAMYYYTNGRPLSELQAVADHGTLFQERPQEQLPVSSTLLVADRLPPTNNHSEAVSDQQHKSTTIIATLKRALRWK
jgi:Rps23 Pro-64 3,4-dihydroxylase Tpa1-like proline 4-hydroxylase